MATKAIRGVDEEAWNILKAFAAERGKSMSSYFNELAGEIKTERAKSNWDKILFWKAKDPKETMEIEKRIADFRKDFRLRVFR